MFNPDELTKQQLQKIVSSGDNKPTEVIPFETKQKNTVKQTYVEESKITRKKRSGGRTDEDEEKDITTTGDDFAIIEVYNKNYKMTWGEKVLFAIVICTWLSLLLTVTFGAFENVSGWNFINMKSYLIGWSIVGGIGAIVLTVTTIIYVIMSVKNRASKKKFNTAFLIFAVGHILMVIFGLIIIGRYEAKHPERTENEILSKIYPSPGVTISPFEEALVDFKSVFGFTTVIAAVLLLLGANAISSFYGNPLKTLESSGEDNVSQIEGLTN